MISAHIEKQAKNNCKKILEDVETDKKNLELENALSMIAASTLLFKTDFYNNRLYVLISTGSDYKILMTNRKTGWVHTRNISKNWHYIKRVFDEIF